MQIRASKKLLVAAMALSLSPFAMAGASITGAGSTWVYPLISKWAATYAKVKGIHVNYQSIGSGGGIAQIEAGTVAFGASDMPLKPAVLEAHHLIQFPTAIAGEDLVMNLPGLKPGQLILSGPVVARIYLGEIKKWNNPAIQALNKGMKLPDMAITVVHRSDGSGTTFTFANYLSKINKTWAEKVGANTSIAWPTGVGGKGNEGVAAYVQRLPGSIGYVEYAYILANHMNYARMYNRAGKLLSPSLKGFQSAASHVNFITAKDFYVILTNQPGADSWPLSGCTWQMLRTNAPKKTNTQVTRFFDWGYEHGQQLAVSIGYGPLPENAVSAIKAYWKTKLGI